MFPCLNVIDFATYKIEKRENHMNYLLQETFQKNWEWYLTFNCDGCNFVSPIKTPWLTKPWLRLRKDLLIMCMNLNEIITNGKFVYIYCIYYVYIAVRCSIWYLLFFFFYHQRKSRRYYPTRLAISLAAGVTNSSSCSSSSDLASTPGAGAAGFIVVETNYRIYAYTSMF